MLNVYVFQIHIIYFRNIFTVALTFSTLFSARLACLHSRLGGRGDQWLGCGLTDGLTDFVLIIIYA